MALEAGKRRSQIYEQDANWARSPAEGHITVSITLPPSGIIQMTDSTR